ncbi:MAG: hypothetical protein IJ985_04990 [Akkermansia sp.]|nr:hypothetical protein [Akkermansia sp.]MBR1978837.1 hypothetical protein [Akkermansia sp.]MBR7109032.1 hypothetical protein [Akkermansia sp.]
MRRFFAILAVLLPVAGFVACLPEVRHFIDEGMVVYGMLLMFGALVIMTLLETLLFKWWVLPAWGRSISERLYAGTYAPEDDALVALADKIRQEKDEQLMPQLVRMVQRDSRRPRAWQELANLQLYEFSQPQEAVASLLQGADKVKAKEDRAFLLYRAAKTCEQHLNDAARAKDLYEQTARRFPRTTYGKLAAKK